MQNRDNRKEKGMIVNLLEERDPWIIGGIGEILASAYLSRKGITLRIWGMGTRGIFGVRRLVTLQDIEDLGLNESQRAYIDSIERNSLIRPPEPGDLSVERPSPGDPDYREKWSRYCEEYREFLRKQGWTGEERWDFIGIGIGLVDGRRPFYVIEVKTTRPGSRRQRSTSGLKQKLPADPDRARAAGFIPLLIVVHLLDSWEFEVIEKKL